MGTLRRVYRFDPQLGRVVEVPSSEPLGLRMLTIPRDPGEAVQAITEAYHRRALLTGEIVVSALPVLSEPARLDVLPPPIPTRAELREQLAALRAQIERQRLKLKRAARLIDQLRRAAGVERIVWEPAERLQAMFAVPIPAIAPPDPAVELPQPE